MAKRMKRCARCGVKKEVSDFHRDKYRLNGYNSRCKECRKKTPEKWRHGYDGLLAAMLRRAKLDWDGVADVTPARARELAGMANKSHTLILSTCRFAVSIGFDCPAQEIETFLASDHLHEWLRLAGCEGLLERLGV